MAIKMFISGISASKEVKKRQLRAQFLLDSYKIKYETIDITDPACESARDKMLAEAKRRNENVPPTPPQFFNEDTYCGDYDDLESANDNDELFRFLKLEEDISIENGGTEGEGEYDLFQPPGTVDTNTEPVEKENDTKDDEDGGGGDEDPEDMKTEVREQITINGVVYDIPDDRKITIGGRVIDVDELLANEAEEISLEDVDDRLKEGFVTSNTTTNGHHNDDHNDDEDESE